MSIDNKFSKISAKVDQNFLWWNSSAGNNVNSTQTSGAYIFRPNGTAPFEINPGSIVKTTVINVSSIDVSLVVHIRLCVLKEVEDGSVGGWREEEWEQWMEGKV